MHTNELPPKVEKEAVLSEIQDFLRIEGSNARFASRGQQANELVNLFEEVAADFEKHDYETTLKVLDRYQRFSRTRADQDIDSEGIPVYDNVRANKIQTWIEFLTELPGKLAE
jgi:hypothetical protein